MLSANEYGVWVIAQNPSKAMNNFLFFIFACANQF